MNEKSARLLIENGVVKKVSIVSSGSKFHVEFKTNSDTYISKTTAGAVKTWSSIDSAAKWIRKLGIGMAQLEISRWQPNQRAL
jgi:hypothetical protein